MEERIPPYRNAPHSPSATTQTHSANRKVPQRGGRETEPKHEPAKHLEEQPGRNPKNGEKRAEQAQDIDEHAVTCPLTTIHAGEEVAST